MFSERLPFNKSYFNPASGSLPSSFAVSTREYGSKYPVFLPSAGLPADSRADHGFSNRGDAQDFSAAQLEQYVELAEMIAFHPDLLSLAERMQELFPHSRFRVPVPSAPSKVHQQKIESSFFTFQKSGDASWKGSVELGIVVISREGQSGMAPSPSDAEVIYASCNLAIDARASGLIASREYDEMRMPSLEAFGRALRSA